MNLVGLYDLDRNIRPVGNEYREFVREWRDILPIEGVRAQGRVLDLKDHVISKRV